MAVNREYKSSVFALLFSAESALLELFNALTGSDYKDAESVEINTLRDALFLGRLNDVSFLYRKRLVVLMEHQATVNPNMALRILLYISQIYETMYGGKEIYSRRQMTIPLPVFIILYNGKEDLPAVMTLRLSDLFAKIPGYKAPLELEVTVYNINKGKNPAIEGKCERLDGYMEMVAKIRENESGGMNTEKAVREAVTYCKAHGTLYDFLCQHGSEVENMLINDYSVADILDFCQKDALQLGLEQGIEKGIEKGRMEGKLETARNLKSFGLALEQIARATGLSYNEVAGL